MHSTSIYCFLAEIYSNADVTAACYTPLLQRIFCCTNIHLIVQCIVYSVCSYKTKSSIIAVSIATFYHHVKHLLVSCECADAGDHVPMSAGHMRRMNV